jgi:hypothetical protein
LNVELLVIKLFRNPIVFGISLISDRNLMIKKIYLIILLLNSKIGQAQNLIPNGNFEQYSGCPVNIGQLDSTLFWMNPATGHPGGTPDYFNECSNQSNVGVPTNLFGFQSAHGGGAYGGIAFITMTGLNYREYLETPIISALTANSCYHFEMYVNLSNKSTYTTDDIGVYFSQSAITNINNYHPLSFTPQITNVTGNIFDTLSWTLVSGDYLASGNENYIIIGNFKDDLNTFTININNNSPIGTQGYVYIDDVALVQIPVCNTGIYQEKKNTSVIFNPNPFSDKLSISNNCNELFDVFIYDISSRKIMEEKSINTVLLNTEQLARGLYLYEVRYNDGSNMTGKIVKN